MDTGRDRMGMGPTTITLLLWGPVWGYLVEKTYVLGGKVCFQSLDSVGAEVIKVDHRARPKIQTSGH